MRWARMRTGNVDLFASAAWGFGVRKVCDEDDPLTGQHWIGEKGQKNIIKIHLLIRDGQMAN